MIEKSKIERIVGDKLAGTPSFVVEVTVTPQNAITVYLDSDLSVSLDECIDMSKYIEAQLDREIEDYELVVSSAGLTEPFKVPRQFAKHIGRDVWVLTSDGMKKTGKLVAFDGIAMSIDIEKKVKVEGSSKKQLVCETTSIPMETVKQVTLNLKF